MSARSRHELARADALYRATARDHRDHAMRLEIHVELPDMAVSNKPQPCRWLHNGLVLAVLWGVALGLLCARINGWIN